jgi:hypothetical protein
MEYVKTIDENVHSLSGVVYSRAVDGSIDTLLGSYRYEFDGEKTGGHQPALRALIDTLQKSYAAYEEHEAGISY